MIRWPLIGFMAFILVLPFLAILNYHQVVVYALTVTSTVFVPPNPLSLHFWWYPMIILFTYDTLFIGTALSMKVPQEDLIFMSVVGLGEASFIAYMMQILPLGFVIAIDIIVYLIAWRALG